MDALRWIAGKFGGLGRGLATRSKWLAKRFWIVMVADVLLTSRRHWKRLDGPERARLFDLAQKSKGRPSNLSAKERKEGSELLDKVGHIEYAGNVAGIVLPFKPLTRIVTKFLSGRRRDQRGAIEAKSGDAPPPRPEPKAGSKA